MSRFTTLIAGRKLFCYLNLQTYHTHNEKEPEFLIIKLIINWNYMIYLFVLYYVILFNVFLLV